MINRAAETKAVKQGLKAAGIYFESVTHGTGTARNWLEIYVGFGNYDLRDSILQVIDNVTDRRPFERGHADNCLVLAQSK